MTGTLDLLSEATAILVHPQFLWDRGLDGEEDWQLQHCRSYCNSEAASVGRRPKWLSRVLPLVLGTGCGNWKAEGTWVDRSTLTCLLSIA